MSEIYKKLAKAIQSMDNPIKDKTAYKYQYADLSQVLSIVKPALYENGLCLMQSVKYSNEIPYLVTSVFDDTERLDLSERRLYDFTDAQATGSSDTYTRRYELMKVFCLVADDDDGASTKNARQVPTDMDKAKQRLWNAEKRYCELNGISEVKAWHDENVATREDYLAALKSKTDFETLNKIAAEIEGEL